MNFMEKSDEEKEQVARIDSDLWMSSYHQRQQQQQNLGGWLVNQHHEPSFNHDEEQVRCNMMVEREHMFDKVVTPSDVGKLNRLVIPKQHAERYFPLDSSNNDKGLLLNFEDRIGKIWRFRYSYWNSSQSYVMTKGWSRFVKDKKLDAGDIVSFQRGVGVTAKDRLFIDWRRRVNVASSPQPHNNLSFSFHNHTFIQPWNPLVLQSFSSRRNPNLMPQLPPNNNLSSRSVYVGPGGFVTSQQQVHMMQRNGFGLGFDYPHLPTSSVAPVQEKSSSGKRLRLFGVNMDCGISEDEEDNQFTHSAVVGRCSNYRSVASSSSSPSCIPYLQLRPNYGGGSESMILPSSSSSTTHDFSLVSKSPSSNMSLDLEI